MDSIAYDPNIIRFPKAPINKVDAYLRSRFPTAYSPSIPQKHKRVRKTSIWNQVKTSNRRALVDYGLREQITESEWRDILEKSRQCCAICGYPCDRLTIDHIIPLSRGGAHHISNIQPACKSCNSRKGASLD